MTGDDALRLYSIAQLADMWNISESYVRQEVQAGRLTPIRMGRGDRNKIRISAEDAANWIKTHRAGSLRSVS